jgi:hypothetical protein
MAHAPPIPQEALTELAKQLAERASPLTMRALSDAKPVGIAESFPVFALGLDAVSDPTRPMSEIAVQTGAWHHQLSHDGTSREYARSVVQGPSPSDWKLSEVIDSASTERISDAIGWIDQNIAGDPVARLLLIPAYYVTAFWLSGPNGDQVVIADKPDQYRSLEYHHAYTSSDFLERLARETHAQGVPAHQ